VNQSTPTIPKDIVASPSGMSVVSSVGHRTPGAAERTPESPRRNTHENTLQTVKEEPYANVNTAETSIFEEADERSQAIYSRSTTK